MATELTKQTAAMNLHKIPAFIMGYKGILINRVNNVDVKIKASLDDLFTEIGPRTDFLAGKKSISAPNPEAMPPPFDMGYSDILINNVYNKDVKMDVKLDDLYTKIGRRKDFLYLKSLYPGGPPPFDEGSDDVLINEVFNTTPHVDIELKALLTKGKFPSPKKEKPKFTLIEPQYYTGHMNLYDPPPFDITTFKSTPSRKKVEKPKFKARDDPRYYYRLKELRNQPLFEFSIAHNFTTSPKEVVEEKSRLSDSKAKKISSGYVDLNSVLPCDLETSRRSTRPSKTHRVIKKTLISGRKPTYYTGHMDLNDPIPFDKKTFSSTPISLRKV